MQPDGLDSADDPAQARVVAARGTAAFLDHGQRNINRIDVVDVRRQGSGDLTCAAADVENATGRIDDEVLEDGEDRRWVARSVLVRRDDGGIGELGGEFRSEVAGLGRDGGMVGTGHATVARA
jgi:hypothetical protein